MRYMKRRGLNYLDEINLVDVGTLHFEKPDLEKYPSLKLGYEVIEHGGLAGAAYRKRGDFG